MFANSQAANATFMSLEAYLDYSDGDIILENGLIATSRATDTSFIRLEAHLDYLDGDSILENGVIATSRAINATLICPEVYPSSLEYPQAPVTPLAHLQDTPTSAKCCQSREGGSDVHLEAPVPSVLGSTEPETFPFPSTSGAADLGRSTVDA